MPLQKPVTVLYMALFHVSAIHKTFNVIEHFFLHEMMITCTIPNNLRPKEKNTFKVFKRFLFLWNTSSCIIQSPEITTKSLRKTLSPFCLFQTLLKNAIWSWTISHTFLTKRSKLNHPLTSLTLSEACAERKTFEIRQKRGMHCP